VFLNCAGVTLAGADTHDLLVRAHPERPHRRLPGERLRACVAWWWLAAQCWAVRSCSKHAPCQDRAFEFDQAVAAGTG